MSFSHSNLGPRPDHPGRYMALLVFLIGIGILIFVFVTALHLFQAPVPGLEPLQTPGAAPPAAAAIGTSLADFARKLLLLGMMTLAGSLLANKGAHLYFSTVYPHAPILSNAPADTNGQGGKEAAVAEKITTE
jgi:hypothetical protein